MKEITATDFRQNLFKTLEAASEEPIVILHNRTRKILISFDEFLKRTKNPKSRPITLEPLISGRILKPLDESTDIELLQYLGLS